MTWVPHRIKQSNYVKREGKTIRHIVEYLDDKIMKFDLIDIC